MRVKAYSWYDPRSSLRQHEDKTGNQMTFWQRLQGVYRIFTGRWNKSNSPAQTRVTLQKTPMLHPEHFVMFRDDAHHS